ncbi:type I-B CRISPR-associated protein Cas8b1/Cst1 [Caldicellulosiruptor owensensis]|uniref:type I-B CRISPR-associated protein Cas8b1/Cst1 n=1 Tax=Caldicellulosiruptor owensensis TaxID=55205 RepID=UPI001EE63A8D|nr:type I-B CRISPR-associated protein Cas8b1/Cst1 [Caldicellulosiruptor owensensis]
MNVEERYYVKKISSIIGKSSSYKNYLQYYDEYKSAFVFFVKNLGRIKEIYDCVPCGFCGRKFEFSDLDILSIKRQIKNEKIEKAFENFLKGVKKYDVRHNALLGPSAGEFPNSFWNKNVSFKICPLCAYLIIHHHKALTRLEDNSEIFINAPSFKVMWYLNKYLQTVYEKEKIATTKELLGMSIIEMALKVNVQLGKWNMMNIEIVTKSNGKVDFFSMPYEITVLLSNHEVASLLNDIGELKVLNLILNSDFIKVLELAERIFKIALKPEKERSEQDKKFISENIKLQKNIENLTSLSYKLFKLYAVIEEKAKKEAFV